MAGGGGGGGRGPRQESLYSILYLLSAVATCDSCPFRCILHGNIGCLEGNKTEMLMCCILRRYALIQWSYA